VNKFTISGGAIPTSRKFNKKPEVILYGYGGH
jgi:hypothetical protein